MENTLLTTGLACLLASIIGGGLKAFDIEIPVLKTWPRQVGLFAFGLILCMIAFNMRSMPSPPAPVAPSAKQEILIQYAQRGGPFLELDPSNKTFPQQGYWWHAMDIRVENHCGEAIHLDPDNFRLYVASTASTSNSAVFAPELITPYSRRLVAGWLEPGKTSEGRLIFQVPEKLPSGAESNGSYHLIRADTQGQCAINYQPY